MEVWRRSSSPSSRRHTCSRSMYWATSGRMMLRRPVSIAGEHVGLSRRGGVLPGEEPVGGSLLKLLLVDVVPRVRPPLRSSAAALDYGEALLTHPRPSRSITKLFALRRRRACSAAGGPAPPKP